MEWSFDGPNGVVTVCREGEQALCRAVRPDGKGGLWKAWLLGERGKVLLGTLIPEGGILRLRRTIPVEQLERQGAWPPTGAELVLAGSAAPQSHPPGWQWTDCPSQLMGEPSLRKAMRCVERALLRRDEEGFLLALPFSPGEVFPAPTLFCLGRIEELGGRRYVLFRFSRRGCPQLLHNFEALGKTTLET